MASIDKSKIGWEHYADYGEGFHDRLATHWPEPREQLHAGGWRMTKRIALELNLADSEGAEGKHYLDLCCGEGASAIQLAKEYNCKITGIDIVEKAINRAKEQAKADKVEHLVTFVACNAFQLPFADGSFDAIFGQDPDALSHQDRVHIFRECLRVLKPNGRFVFFHHWIPGLGFPEDEAKAIDAKNEELKFLAMNNCNADTYLKDMKTAGFVIDDAEDIGDLAAAHLRGVALSHYKKNGKIGDAWLQNNLDYIDRGRRFGLWCTAHKEGSSQGNVRTSSFNANEPPAYTTTSTVTAEELAQAQGRIRALEMQLRSVDERASSAVAVASTLSVIAGVVVVAAGIRLYLAR